MAWRRWVNWGAGTLASNTPRPVRSSTHSLASRDRRCRSSGFTTSFDQFLVGPLLAVPAEGVRQHPIGGLQQLGVSLDGIGPDLLGCIGQSGGMVQVNLPSENFSLTLGMSDNFRATFAIRLDSRCGRRALVRRISAWSES